MSDTETHAERTEGIYAERSRADQPFPFSFNSGELAALGKKRMEAFVNAQTELLDEIQEANRRWMDRFQSEANLASEFASKLSGVRTIPDAMAVSRDWATQRASSSVSASSSLSARGGMRRSVAATWTS